MSDIESIIYDKYQFCDCSVLCYSCFLDLYIIDNVPPCNVTRTCKMCFSNFTQDTIIQLFLFTLDYFSSEYCFCG